VPWRLLKPHRNARSVGESEAALCVIPVEVLTALRGSYFGSLLDPQPWYQGGIFLPPHQIVLAYLLTEEKSEETTLVTNAASCPENDQPFANDLAAKVEVDTDRAYNRNRMFGSFLGRFSFTRRSLSHLSVVHAQPGVVCPATCLQFTNHMKRLRAVCKVNGLELVYLYTQVQIFPLILKTGFRMSTQGQGDGGVYFSTLGPAAYKLGTDKYEENIIVDCFGEERLEEYKGKGMLDLCLVYGAEPGVLSQAPGGRDNAKMVTKAIFQTFALPAESGNYFLRPDRLLGAFFLPASQQPVG
jgi:hypothetical protein